MSAELIPRAAPVAQNLLQVSQDFSIAPALEISAQLVPLKFAVMELEEQLPRVKIDSPEAFQKGTEYLSVSKQVGDQLETFRKSVYMPVFDYAKFIQSMFKPLIDRNTAVQKEAGQRMLAYQNAERDRQEAEREAARKRQEEAALQLAQEREKAGDVASAEAIMEAATLAPAPLPVARMATTNSFGQRGQTTARWVGAVEDPMAVLRAILELKVPISVIDWKQSELNKVATSIKVAGTHNGIKVAKEESFGMHR